MALHGPLPETIGRFRIQQLLGYGAMGVVYKAYDPAIDRAVAIKLVRIDLVEGTDHVSSFPDEARAIGRLVHPNIVGIHDFSFHDGMPFLVLEFVDGRDFSRVWPGGTQAPLVLAAGLILKVLDALGYAHDLGIIHRDIKPANIMVTKGLGVKVTDFGISRAFAGEPGGRTAPIGTPSYMAPEQCLGEPLDTRSDIFSLGCVFYELLAGRRCFAGDSIAATTRKILHEPPPPLREARAGLPDAIVEIVERALARHPRDRFASAAEMAQALRAALRNAAPSTHDDPNATVAMPVACRQSRPELDALGAASLATIERCLAHHTGPMARLHICRALAASHSTAAFACQLGALVPEADRDGTASKIANIIAADPAILALRSRDTMPASARLDEAQIAALTRALAEAIGPIAHRIVLRNLADGKSVHDVIEACVGAIERPEDQARLRRVVATLELVLDA